MLIEKDRAHLSEEDLAVIEIVDDPVFFGEFIRSTEDELKEELGWVYDNYQRLMLLDESSYVSVCTGRATGKTASLESKLIWTAISNKYRGTSSNEVLLVVQNKAQLDPVFLRLVQFLRKHPLLRHFIDRGSINFSQHEIKLLNDCLIRCRIVGSSADSNVIGLHVPCVFVDEAQVFNYVAWNSLLQCFPAGTRVMTENGYKNIEDMVAGDVVVSALEKGYKKVVFQKVKKVIQHKRNTDKCFKIITQSGNSVICTSEHRFLTNNAKGGNSEVYKPARRIKKGDILVTNLKLDLGSKIDSITADDLIYGSMLGDMYIHPRGHITVGQANEQFTLQKHKIIGKTEKPYTVQPEVGNTIYRFEVGGYKHLREFFYPESLQSGTGSSRKVLTQAWLDKVTEAGLAFWYMDDGSYNGSVQISTFAFTYDEHVMLVNHLKEKFGLIFDIHETAKGNYLVCNPKSRDKFLQMTAPYVQPSMYYKYLTTTNDVVKDVKTVSTIKVVYDLEIDGIPNYTANDFVVHNCINMWEPNFQLWVSGVPNGLREKNVLYEVDQLDDNFSRHRVSRLESKRYTPAQYHRDLKQYGGEGGDDFVHLVKGEHGSPAFSVFDRKQMKIEDYPVATSIINNLTLKAAGGNFSELLYAPPPSPPMERYKLWACYSDDTEVLTDNGWKLFKNLAKEDKIATLSEKGCLEYQSPINYISYKYTGDMCGVDSRFLDLLVTPNHNLYVAHTNRGNYLNKNFELVPAEEVINKSLRFKNTCKFEGKNISEWVIPSYDVEYSYNNRWDGINSHKHIVPKLLLNTEAFVEFLGYFISEGSLDSHRIIISQSKKNNEDFYNKIDNCLHRLGVLYTRQDDGFRIGNAQIARYLRSFGMDDSYKKHIPREFLDLSKKYLRILFDALMLGDGYKRDNTYSTCSKRLADDFQELVFRLGYSSSITVRNNIGRKAPNGITRGFTYVINFQTKYLNPIINTRGVTHSFTKHYEGTVYCVEVPNHIIMVRRNGKPVWCGNCGIDAGFSNDPTIISILWKDSHDAWRFFARYELRRINYPTQAKIIDWLDTVYGFNMLTLDAGHSGLALGQMLQEQDEFKAKNFSKRLILVDFQGSVITGYDDEGKEQKDRVRKFTIQTLQNWAQGDPKRIIFSSQDEEVVNELERVGFTRDMLGVPKFFVYSPNGGQGGDDHNLASILTWVYGYYYEYFSPVPAGKGRFSDLATGGWNSIKLR